MKRRNLFAEISEGFEALELEREREAKSHERLPAVTPSRAPAPLCRAEVHRYECQGIDEMKMKVKQWL